MDRARKEELVASMHQTFQQAATVVVTHYSGMTVAEMEDLRKQIHDSGAKFQVTRNRLARRAIEGTKYETLATLFDGPTAIAYSDNPVAPAKVAVNFEKKIEKFKIIGGGFDGEKINLEKINFLATLPSLDELRGQIVGLISAPAQKIASIVKEPAGQMARLVSAQSKSLEKSN